MTPKAGPWFATRAAAALCLAWILAACAGPRPPRKQEFLRLRSAHFTLFTDLQRRDAEARLRDLEAQLAALAAHGWEGVGTLSVQVNVVLFSDPQEFRAYAANPKLQGYYGTSVLFEPWIVFPAPHGTADLGTLNHELTHYLAGQVMPYQPRWLAEGLASYFESAHFSEEGEFVIGDFNWRATELLAQGPMEADLLLDLNVDPFMDGFYNTAWLLVHYLMSERGDDFAKYQDRLARAASHVQAWNESFPDLRGAGLDLRLKSYLTGRRFAYFTFPARRQHVPIAVTSMSRADQEALRAALWATSSRSDAPQRAREHIAAALALDPNQPMARALDVQLKLLNADSSASPAAADLAKRQPGDWRAWLLLAMTEELTKAVPDEAGALAYALSLAPRQPYVLMTKAFRDGRTGKRQEATATAAQAVRLFPGDAGLWWLRAHLLVSLSACDELAIVTQRLRQIGHAKLAPDELARLDRWEATCGRDSS
jgi:hypothetical protein